MAAMCNNVLKRAGRFLTELYSYSLARSNLYRAESFIYRDDQNY